MSTISLFLLFTMATQNIISRYLKIRTSKANPYSVIQQEVLSCYDATYAEFLSTLFLTSIQKKSYDKECFVALLLICGQTLTLPSFLQEEAAKHRPPVLDTWLNLKYILFALLMSQVVLWLLYFSNLDQWIRYGFEVILINAVIGLLLIFSVTYRFITRFRYIVQPVFSYLMTLPDSTEANLILQSWSVKFARLLYGRRPTVIEVELALKQIQQTNPTARRKLQKPLTLLQVQQKNHGAVPTLIDRLSMIGWQERFVARHALVHIGGDAIDDLIRQFQLIDNNPYLYHTIHWILQNIGKDTQARIAGQEDAWLCPRCITSCQAHILDTPSGVVIQYYGCRLCHNSHDLIRRPKETRLILDTQQETRVRYLQDGAILQVTWQPENPMFVFDAVEVHATTDKMVEQFVLTLGEASLKQEYRTIPCKIMNSARLSENSRRLLSHTFTCETS
ncbi:MAG: hypothetical protein AAF629_04285 [Chloroflexota bacterium]